jgi:uncharacterized protein (DUF1778 family)
MALALERLDARITAEEKELFQEAADAKGLTLTAFVTSSAHEAALKVLKEQHIIELGRKDQQAFAQAMLEPAPPNERLRTLAKRPGFRRR